MKSSPAVPVLFLSLLCSGCAPDLGARAATPPRTDATARELPPGDTDDNTVNERIRRVERGLLPVVIVEGATAPEMTIADRLVHYHVPGVSVAVIHGGEIAWARSYGVTEAGGSQPVTPDTIFQACSISKPVAALAALRQVQEGKLALDEDVNVKLRSFKVPESPLTKTKKVTLRRLLSHSAGLTVHGFDGYASGAPLPTLAQILEGKAPANSAPIRVDLEPGSQFRYSGGGYCVVQQLLEDVLQRPFPEIMREAVLEPLGMAHSTYEQPLSARLAPTAAVAHTDEGKKVAGNWHAYPEMAAAGLWTTPSDLARLALEIQKARRGNPGRILSKEMADQMLTPQLGGFGLGLMTEGSGASARFMHTGANEGYRSLLVIDERDLGVVVMTNGDSGSGLGDEIVRAVAKEYGLHGFEVKRKKIARVDPRSYQAYAGRYQISDDFILTFTVDHDRLMVDNSEGQRAEVFPESEMEFFYTIFDAQLTFGKDPTGKITQVVLHQRGQDMTGKRVER